MYIKYKTKELSLFTEISKFRHVYAIDEPEGSHAGPYQAITVPGMDPRPSGSRQRPRPRPDLPRPRRDRDVCQTVRDETETRPSSVRDVTETRPFSGRDYIETHGLYMHGICTSHCVPKKNPLD